MKRRKKILIALTLVVCVVTVCLAVKWMMLPTPEMRPDFTVDLGDGVTLKMIWIPGGTFEMGAEPTTYERAKRTVAGWFGKTINLPYEANESPVHVVELDGFWMGETEVTQEQYEAIMGENPSTFPGPDYPVETVSWDDATEFCRKLSAKTSQTFMLPTEAQWEYACRAGSRENYSFGEDEGQLDAFAWYNQNSNDTTHPVGKKKPNAWGLYDMHGNVWEYCRDSFGNFRSGRQKNPLRTGGSLRVLRGGSWFRSPGHCRSAFRTRPDPGLAPGHRGFRIVRTQK